jgi:hypothetical protein
VENAACHLTRQDWGVPIVVTADGPSRLPLILRGMDENGTGKNGTGDSRTGDSGTGDSGTGEN